MADKKFGIDISRWQGDFDINRAIKNHGVQFAIIKIGGGDNVCYKDSQFERNYAKCEAAGLPKGCYFFGRALTMEGAKKEVEYWLNLMKGHKFEYPVFYDVEGDMIRRLTQKQLTEIVKYVCSTIEAAGYWVGIYSSSSAFNSEVFDSELAPYSHWVACWGRSLPKLKSGNETQMWQFGGETNLIQSNKINGQTVDQDYCYIDYPRWVKAAGLNGYPKPKKTKKTVKEETK